MTAFFLRLSYRWPPAGVVAFLSFVFRGEDFDGGAKSLRSKDLSYIKFKNAGRSEIPVAQALLPVRFCRSKPSDLGFRTTSQSLNERGQARQQRWIN
jgi:hypothetical protein